MKIWSKLFPENTHNINRAESRIEIATYHSLTLVIENEQYSVDNISMSGMGFICQENSKFKIGQRLDAKLNLAKFLLDIELEIVHLTHNLVGAKVLFSDESMNKKLVDYFAGELNALSLRKVSSSSLKKDENGEPHWFYGNRNHELYFTTRKDLITTFQINYHGHIIVDQKTKFHIGIQIDDTNPGDHKASKLISGKVELQPDFKKMIMRFINSIESLDPVYKKQILSRLSKKFGVVLDA